MALLYRITERIQRVQSEKRRSNAKVMCAWPLSPEMLQHGSNLSTLGLSLLFTSNPGQDTALELRPQHSRPRTRPYAASSRPFRTHSHAYQRNMRQQALGRRFKRRHGTQEEQVDGAGALSSFKRSSPAITHTGIQRRGGCIDGPRQSRYCSSNQIRQEALVCELPDIRTFWLHAHLVLYKL
ncbi:hypothetical protein AAFF_G00123890 [Aldrovandia affinis]|uniref:Uncharacterized protein n=1 Tax=Aldrovandia affinis TaxID=143900 RepID=A0AAD7RRQ0_9TELE|nr:hypothetical protein AAFF_G00123890 [Aldrovandia affinis]